MWLAGYPAAGKTFMGDYLATRGWCHIDGDMGQSTQDPVIQEAFGKLWEGMMAAQGGQSVSKDLWHPYYNILIKHIKDAVKKHDKVCLSFVVMGLFEGEEALIRKNFPNIEFIYVKCNTDILVQRFYDRGVELCQQAGQTLEEMWKSEENADARAQFGEEFDDANYRKYIKVTYYDPPMVRLEHNPAKGCYCVCNDDLASNQGIRELNKVLGLADCEIDKAAINQVQLDRMKGTAI